MQPLGFLFQKSAAVSQISCLYFAVKVCTLFPLHFNMSQVLGQINMQYKER